MKLSYDEKIRILDSFAPKLTKHSIIYGKTNYYFDESKYRRKVAARELTKSGKFVKSENEFIILIQKVIASFR